MSDDEYACISTLRWIDQLLVHLFYFLVVGNMNHLYTIQFWSFPAHGSTIQQ